jgi:sulfoxide reductase heme-binding subunit YedZ
MPEQAHTPALIWTPGRLLAGTIVESARYDGPSQTAVPVVCRSAMSVERRLPMAARGGQWTGWPMVGWSTTIIAALMATLLSSLGTGEVGLRAVVRSSAQTSFVLFLSAFSASALSRMWPTPATRWLRVNRRYLGVSFAASHFIHLAAIVALAYAVPDFERDAATLIGGGMAYVFIAAMAATSFDRSAAWIGPRAWRTLHLTGAYYVWFIFFISYLPRTLLESAWYAPFVLLLLAAVGLRAIAWRKRR